MVVNKPVIGSISLKRLAPMKWLNTKRSPAPTGHAWNIHNAKKTASATNRLILIAFLPRA